MLDAEEKKYQALRRLGSELHIPVWEAFLELEVKDKDGRVIQRHRQRSHSWVRNAYNQLVTQLMGINGSDETWGAGYINIMQSSGTVMSGTRVATICNDSADPEGAPYAYMAAAGSDTSGILVGSGTTAETFEDYNVETLIANGVGAGQLSYVASDPPAKTYTAGTKVYQVQHVRYFNNNSGASINVNEVALLCSGEFGGSRMWANSRDVLGSSVAVPDTGQLKVTYTIEITYPA